MIPIEPQVFQDSCVKFRWRRDDEETSSVKGFVVPQQAGLRREDSRLSQIVRSVISRRKRD